ncbi:MAG: CHAT domain-containing protein [Verrucomicrobiaceae bacterium]|nr:CHAT domain-containing protein [Verrucomicrobiaceae bacterium]
MLATYGNAQVLADFPVRDHPSVKKLGSILHAKQPSAAALKQTFSLIKQGVLNGDDGLMGTRFHEVIRICKAVRKFTDGDLDELPQKDIRECGRLLFDLLMRPPVRRLYDLARASCAGRPLHVTFTSQIPWVAGNPWELVFDPHAGGAEGRDDTVRGDDGAGMHLATGEVIFSRNVLTPRPAVVPRRGGPLRILVVSAQPINAGRLSIAEEEEFLRRGFQDLIDVRLAVVQVLPQADPVRLQKTLALASYDVVHVISHGSFDREGQEGGLEFVDANGLGQHITERELCLILCHRGIQVVFLNACESGVGGKRRFNSGMAAALVESGIPSVVANQFTVDDWSATVFAQHFYWYLAHGLTIGAAAREARVAVRCFVGRDAIDWAVPVLYTGDPHLRLCTQSAASGAPVRPVLSKALLPVVGGGDRGSGNEKRLGVAVWDVPYHFPRLRKTLDRLNEVQRMFRFRQVDGTMPYGMRVWQVGSKDPQGKNRRFDAARAAAMLKRLPSLLGADLVACIIDQPIWDADDEMELYQLGLEASPVCITSTKEFRARLGVDALRRTPEHQITEDRFIMMTAVTSILWLQPELGSCAENNERCILYFDDNYDMPFLNHRPTLCPACRKLFHYTPDPQRTQEALEALKAMMGAFY